MCVGDFAMTAHARLSASSAQRWMNCTGSPDLCEGKVSHTSRYAQEGTDAHTHAENMLNGMSPEINDPDMLDAVQVYVTYCQQLMSEADEHHIEKTVNLDNLYWDSKPPEPLFGTVDFGAAVGTTLHVVDYKHGKGIPVDAKGNAQLAYYGLGLFFAMTKGNEKRFTDIELTIIQPRASHPEGPVRTWYLSVKELMDWGKDFKHYIDLIAKKETLLVTGTWCRFCPSAGDCPEAHRHAVDAARLDFGAIPKTKPETLSDEALTEILDGLEFAQNWINAVAAEAQGRLERGNKLEGWKLVQKRAIRKWVDPLATSIWLKAALTPDEFAQTSEAKMRSPAQMEKLFKKFATNLPDNLVEKKSSGTTLAPDSDSRPGVASGPASEFTSVPDEI